MSDESNLPKEAQKRDNKNIILIVAGVIIFCCLCCAALLVGQYLLENSNFSLVQATHHFI
jgi:hypothetical protein